jgi:hypothetical protein
MEYGRRDVTAPNVINENAAFRSGHQALLDLDFLKALFSISEATSPRPD